MPTLDGKQQLCRKSIPFDPVWDDLAPCYQEHLDPVGEECFRPKRRSEWGGKMPRLGGLGGKRESLRNILWKLSERRRYWKSYQLRVACQTSQCCNPAHCYYAKGYKNSRHVKLWRYEHYFETATEALDYVKKLKSFGFRQDPKRAQDGKFHVRHLVSKEHKKAPWRVRWAVPEVVGHIPEVGLFQAVHLEETM